VERLELIQEDRALDQDEISELLDSKRELYDINHDEVIKWSQRVKDKWLKDRDVNTKYFHTIASHNLKIYIIPKIIVNGSEVRDPKGIKKHILNFYKKIFGKGGITWGKLSADVWDESEKVSSISNSLLTAPFSMKEIHKAIFGIGADKTSELDGFFMSFLSNILGCC
jgi:hypothetical protein